MNYKHISPRKGLLTVDKNSVSSIGPGPYLLIKSDISDEEGTYNTFGKTKPLIHKDIL